MAGYVFSGPGYASDLASGKVSLNTSLPNAAEYAKYVPGGSQVIESPTVSSSSGSSRVQNDDYEDLREIASMAHDYDIQAQEFSAAEAAKNREWNSNEAALAREFNKAEAEAARVFNASEAAKSRDFNASEAQKTRDWQEKMSKNSHQYEIQDLIAAGLNPVLSAKYGGANAYSGAMASGSGASGSGASSGGGASSGAAGQSSNSAGSLLGTLFSAIINSATTMAKTSIERMNLIDELESRSAVARINGDYSLASADIYGSATRYSSDNAYRASIYGSDTSYAATDLSSSRNLQSARITSENTKQVAQIYTEVDKYIHENYPTSMWATLEKLNKQFAPDVLTETGASTVTEGVAEVIHQIVRNYGRFAYKVKSHNASHAGSGKSFKG